MKRYGIACTCALLFVLMANTGLAQFFYPPSLVEDLGITGVERWEIVKAGPGEAFEGQYIANLKVRFENKSQYNVVFRNPDFTVYFRVPKREVIDPARTSVVTGGAVSGDIHPVQRHAMETIVFGKAIIEPDEGEDQPDLKVPAPTGGAKSRETVKEFKVVLGPAGVDTTDRLIKIFNMAVNNDPDWSTLIKGTSTVGLTGEKETATVFSKDSIQIEITSKPKVVVAIDNF